MDCDQCDGTGYRTCPVCNGSGGGPEHLICGWCYGSGHEGTCRECDGDGDGCATPELKIHKGERSA